MRHKKYNLQYFAVGILFLLFSSCASTKYVPDGSYLLDEVKIDVKESAQVEHDVREALRYLKEIGIIDNAADEAAYKLILFEECT